MAISINRVSIVGRLGADPQTRGSGEVPVTMRVATSESWTKDGERQERTQWHSVVVWNTQAAKFAAKYLKKGDLVAVEGGMEYRKWERDDGNERDIAEVVVRPFSGSVQGQSTRGGDSGGDSRDDRDSGETSRSRDQGSQSRSGWEDDEIPF